MRVYVQQLNQMFQDARDRLQIQETNQKNIPEENQDHLHLHAACHPAAGVRAMYNPNTCTLKLVCFKCGKSIANVAVALEPNGFAA